MRKWHLKTVFDKFGATIPVSLRKRQNQNTQRWHYITVPYPYTYCNTLTKPNVVVAISTLKSAFHQTENKNTQGVLLVFLAHLVADAHQPLHGFSLVDSHCQDDAGGTQYCLMDVEPRGSCNYTKTLHALWDKGVGLLPNRSENIAQRAIRITKHYPRSGFITELHLHDPKQWIRSSYEYAKFIYSTPRGKKPSRTYIQSGHNISRQQIALAGYRLARVIEDIL